MPTLRAGMPPEIRHALIRQSWPKNRETLLESRRAQWQMPEGVPPGVWLYAAEPHIAEEYDADFVGHPLFGFDEQFLARRIDRPGLVVDLGCGTGRSLLPLARRGFPTLAVDLSLPMLRIVGRKAAEEGLHINRVRANLVELGCLRGQIADYVLCMFSTLGMIRPRENRRKVLVHARRILRPGGTLILHVHNFWYNLRDAGGRAWLWTSFTQALLRRDTEPGDKFFHFHGIPQMFVHAFRLGELKADLRHAGFRIDELVPLSVNRQRPLPFPWLLGRLRANGWIVVCR